MDQSGPSRRFLYRRKETLEVREVSLARPAPRACHEVANLPTLGSVARMLTTWSRNHEDASMSSPARYRAAENPRLGSDVANMQKVQADWQKGTCMILYEDKARQFAMRRKYCNMNNEICTSSKRTASGGQQPKPTRCWPKKKTSPGNHSRFAARGALGRRTFAGGDSWFRRARKQCISKPHRDGCRAD